MDNYEQQLKNESMKEQFKVNEEIKFDESAEHYDRLLTEKEKEVEDLRAEYKTLKKQVKEFGQTNTSQSI